MERGGDQHRESRRNSGEIKEPPVAHGSRKIWLRWEESSLHFYFLLYPVVPLDIRPFTNCKANFMADKALTSIYHWNVKQVRLRVPLIWYLQYKCHMLQSPSLLAWHIYCHCVNFKSLLTCTWCPLAGTHPACYVSVQCLGQCGFGFSNKEQRQKIMKAYQS